jgi:hypothetical protein
VRRLVLALAVASLGCGAAAAPPATVTLAPLAPISAEPPRAPEGATPHAGDRAGAAPGYVEVVVLGLDPAMQGGSTLLVGPRDASLVLQLLIGGSEAVSIDKRRQGERFERPLTHDLFDAALHEMGATVVKAQIDDRRGAAFIGSLFIESNGRVIELDSRASDAIAMALGDHAPIYCSKRLLEQDGVKRDVSPP